MTQTLLRIHASARTADSVSREIADAVAARIAPETTILRDLAETPVPQLDADWLGANFTQAHTRSPEQRATLDLSDKLIAEIQAADTILIALPIYNFGVPASLKAWFDMVARAGVTFQYSETGPKGLLEGKRAIFVVASGGTEVDGPMDFATPWLRHAMGFVGITEVQVVRSDRQMVDAEASKARAEEDLKALAA